VSRSRQASPPTTRDLTAEIEQALREQSALPDLQRLVRRRCDRAVLLVHLALLRHSDPGLDDLGFWTGQNRRQLKALVQRLRKCASEIESLSEKPFKAVLSIRSRAALGTLAEDLRDYSTVVLNLLAEVSGRKRLSRDMQLAALVRYVSHQTARFCDREVAALVSVVLGKEYFLDAHKAWRLKKYRRLAEALDDHDAMVTALASASHLSRRS
jgi:hypothetical protein